MHEIAGMWVKHHTILNKMNLKQKFDIYNSDTLSLKQELEQYITDRNIALEDRWDVWVDAPSALKNHESYIIHLKSLPEDFIMYEGEYPVERHQTVNTSDIIECIKEGSWDRVTGNPVPYNIDINAVKEEIISLNLGSFVYDW